MYSRNTIQRDLVRQAVTQLPHPTAEEVYACITSKHPSVSKATVYRNLGVLVDIGEILRFSTGESSVRYDYNTVQHSHTCCKRCGKVEDVFNDELTTLLDRVTKDLKNSGFSSDKCELVFHGICHSC